METGELKQELARARERFLELVAELRPELHRYCARLTGSVIDGEDVVQDTLAKAFYSLGSSRELPPLRPLLFRIAHNTAMDALRRYEHRFVEPLGDVPEHVALAEPADPEIVSAALAEFLRLPVAQRSAVILKDVLGCSLEEIADATGASVTATKAALFRGRTALRAQHAAANVPEAPRVSPAERTQLHRYAELFNRRDWDALRALLSEDARLELVSRHQRYGKGVGEYFARYADLRDLRVVPGTLEGRPVLAMFTPRHASHPTNFVFLEW
ncbi:MAG TPA: sigma-70 family RNA polymerase sigma factor, partial [Polyangiaceae bacterium]|nr:sigma-70 family RNA polymerase sigma factor [Polyangiaceae bacterium]